MRDVAAVRLLVWDEAEVHSRQSEVLVAEPPKGAEPDLAQVYRWLAQRCEPDEAAEACLFTAVVPGQEAERAAAVTAVREQGFAVHVRQAGPDGRAELSDAMWAMADASSRSGRLREVVVAGHDPARFSRQFASLAERGIAVVVLGFREQAGERPGEGGVSFVDLEDVPGAYRDPLPRTNLYDLPRDGRTLPPLRRPTDAGATSPTAPGTGPTAAPAPVDIDLVAPTTGPITPPTTGPIAAPAAASPIAAPTPASPTAPNVEPAAPARTAGLTALGTATRDAGPATAAPATARFGTFEESTDHLEAFVATGDTALAPPPPPPTSAPEATAPGQLGLADVLARGLDALARTEVGDHARAGEDAQDGEEGSTTAERSADLTVDLTDESAGSPESAGSAGADAAPSEQPAVHAPPPPPPPPPMPPASPRPPLAPWQSSPVSATPINPAPQRPPSPFEAPLRRPAPPRQD